MPDTLPVEAGDHCSTHTALEASGNTSADGQVRAEGGEVALGASTGKKRERAAGGGQTGGDNETRSVTKDATATAIEQTPLSGIPAVTPAQVMNKRHKSTKSTASTLDIVPS